MGAPPPPSPGSSLLAPPKEVIERLAAAGRAVMDAMEKASESGERELAKELKSVMDAMTKARSGLLERHRKKVIAMVKIATGPPLARTPTDGGPEINSPLSMVRGIKGAA